MISRTRSLKRLIVFGGCGFVGGNLAKIAEEENWCVSVASRTTRLGLDGVEVVDRHRQGAVHVEDPVALGVHPQRAPGHFQGCDSGAGAVRGFQRV